MAEVINIGTKGVQGHLDPVAEVKNTRKIDDQDPLVIHESDRVHLHTQGTEKAAGMVMKREGLVLQCNLGHEETVILGIILSPTSALESLGLVATHLKESSTTYSRSMDLLVK